MAHPQFKMRPVYKQVSTVRAQSLACLSSAELTVELIKSQTLCVLVYTFISISLRLRSGMVSVQLPTITETRVDISFIISHFPYVVGPKRRAVQ